MQSHSRTDITDQPVQGSIIRNICILAHVDHGKTTLADTLLSVSNIIMTRQAGSVRYMDNREDEQKRKITMKTSCISMLYDIAYDAGPKEWLQLNLVDTPGHIDFSSEVTAAVRVCDGALIVVDVVEGICSQTLAAMKHAYTERCSMVLILNKIDRLFVELNCTGAKVKEVLQHVIENANVYLAQLHSFEAISRMDAGFEENTDDAPSFSPSSGNVVFASAVHGWGFTLEQISTTLEKDLKLNKAQILPHLWDFNSFYNNATKRIESTTNGDHKCLFVTHVLQRIKEIYGEVFGVLRRDRVEFMLCRYGIIKESRDLYHTDATIRIRAFFDNLQPLSKALVRAITTAVRAPTKITVSKINQMLGVDSTTLDENQKEARAFAFAHLKNCTADVGAVTMAYVSKVYPIRTLDLPDCGPKRATVEELMHRRKVILAGIAARKEKALTMRQNEGSVAGGTDSSRKDTSDDDDYMSDRKKKRKEKKMYGGRNKSRSTPSVSVATGAVGKQTIEESTEQLSVSDKKTASTASPDTSTTEDDSCVTKADDFPITLMAFTRIYSGSITVGDQLYCTAAHYNPGEAQLYETVEEFLQNSDTIKRFTVKSLYTMRGRHLETINKATAGHIIAIGGFDECTSAKTGTLVSSIRCPSLYEHSVPPEPMMRNAIEPVNPSDMPVLHRGIKHLIQTDSSLQAFLNEQGEHVLLTAGSVHLEKCLEDLKIFYAPIEVKLSSPMISLRETLNVFGRGPATLGIQLTESDVKFNIEAFSMPVPTKLTVALRKYHTVLRSIEKFQTDSTADVMQKIRTQYVEEPWTVVVPARLLKTFANDYPLKVYGEIKKIQESIPFEKQMTGFFTGEIWSVGENMNDGNLFIIAEPTYKYCSIVNRLFAGDSRAVFDKCLKEAFHEMCRGGPLCDEPLMNVCFVVTELRIENFDPAATDVIQHLALRMRQAACACLRTTLLHFGVLMEPVFEATITVDDQVLGRVHDVIHKHSGSIVDGRVLDSNEKSTVVKAIIPMRESVMFTNDIRKCSSGKANPHLQFSHYRTINEDPEDIDTRAFQIVKEARKRKGLSYKVGIVVAAEKQRTLNKKK